MLGWRIRDVVSPTHYILKELYNRGTKLTFVRHVNDRFMKDSIPLTLLAAVRTFADGVNAEFTVIPRSLICSHFVINSPFQRMGQNQGESKVNVKAVDRQDTAHSAH